MSLRSSPSGVPLCESGVGKWEWGLMGRRVGRWPEPAIVADCEEAAA